MTRLGGTDLWNWREDGAARARVRAETRLRLRGAVQAGVLVVFAVLLRYVWHHVTAGHVFFMAGVVVLLAAVWRPHLLQPLHRFGELVGRGAGVGLTWLLLVPFFVVCVVPAGLVLRLRGTDPLERRPLPKGLTGWIPRRLEPTPDSLVRQFLVEDRAARRLQRPDGPPSERAWPAPGAASAADGSRERP